MNKLLTLQEIAAILNVHENTVRRLVANGQLQAIKISSRGDLRFRQTDLDAYLTRAETAING